jgi:hypothetical protein
MIAPLALLLAAMPATAAERTWPVASFTRLRVEGAVDVDVADGSPRAQASADDRRMLDRLTISLDGDTLLVRLVSPATGPRARVSLAALRLSSIRHQGSGAVSVARLTGSRVDLSSTGGGSLAVARIDTPLLAATLVGEGEMTLAGRAADARLTLNGPGLLDAAALAAAEAAVTATGEGEVRGAARYAARVAANGKGRVTVAGPMTCTVRALGGAAVRCGK